MSIAAHSAGTDLWRRECFTGLLRGFGNARSTRLLRRTCISGSGCWHPHLHRLDVCFRHHAGNHAQRHKGRRYGAGVSDFPRAVTSTKMLMHVRALGGHAYLVGLRDARLEHLEDRLGCGDGERQRRSRMCRKRSRTWLVAGFPECTGDLHPVVRPLHRGLGGAARSGQRVLHRWVDRHSDGNEHEYRIFQERLGRLV